MKNWPAIVAVICLIPVFGCSDTREIKEPSREGFNAGELSPATSEAPKAKTQSTTID